MNNVNTKIRDIYIRGINDGRVETYNDIMEFLNSITEHYSKNRVPPDMTIGDVSYMIAKAMHDNFGNQEAS